MTEKQCSLFIRPESIILEPDDSIDNLNRFEVTVQTILFDGSNTKVLANLDGLELTIALPQNKQFAHISPGDVIAAGVHLESCK
jgi:spermidine/putrescine transport system ATP-binding protein